MTEPIIAKITQQCRIVPLWPVRPAEFNSFSGVFTISDAVTISLLLTDDGLFPQERKSGVALWRRDDGATGQKGPGGAQEITHFTQWLIPMVCSGIYKVRNVVAFRRATNMRGHLHGYICVNALLNEILLLEILHVLCCYISPLCRFLPFAGPEATVREWLTEKWNPFPLAEIYLGLGVNDSGSTRFNTWKYMKNV